MSQNLMPDDTRQQLGAIVRQLHDALQTLGYDAVLHEVAREIPDARERLSYVGRMTEQAALKVLTLVDQAKPACADLARDGLALLEHPGSTGAHPWRAFAERAVSQAQTQQATLDEIMMAQDFQDLTGQVIKRLVELTRTLETQLLQVLIEAAPAQALEPEQAAGLLNGPVIDPAGRSDVVQDQAQVDELLERLGF